MTTENFKEIRNAIATLKAKRNEIMLLGDKIAELEYEYSELYESLFGNNKDLQVIEIARDIEYLRDVRSKEYSQADQTFPVDEPLEKTEPVENWEAKDIPPTDEDFATAFSSLPSGVSDVSGHYPTGQEPDAAPALSNELESATGGDARADSTFQPIAF